MDEHPFPEEHLARLVGDEGPAMALFVEMAAKYGLPLRDGDVPLSTEMNVMLTDWRVHLLDVTKTGFGGAIGFKLSQQPLASFGFWPQTPQGCDKPGYFDVFDRHPTIEVHSGRWWRSFGSRVSQLSTRVKVDGHEYAGYASQKNRKVWVLIGDIVSRALELQEKFGFYECDDHKLRR